MSNSGRPSTGSPLDPARGDPELVEGEDWGIRENALMRYLRLKYSRDPSTSRPSITSQYEFLWRFAQDDSFQILRAILNKLEAPRDPSLMLGISEKANQEEK